MKKDKIQCKDCLLAVETPYGKQCMGRWFVNKSEAKKYSHFVLDNEQCRKYEKICGKQYHPVIKIELTLFEY